MVVVLGISKDSVESVSTCLRMTEGWNSDTLLLLLLLCVGWDGSFLVVLLLVECGVVECSVAVSSVGLSSEWSLSLSLPSSPLLQSRWFLGADSWSSSSSSSSSLIWWYRILTTSPFVLCRMNVLSWSLCSDNCNACCNCWRHSSLYNENVVMIVQERVDSDGWRWRVDVDDRWEGDDVSDSSSILPLLSREGRVM